MADYQFTLPSGLSLDETTTINAGKYQISGTDVIDGNRNGYFVNLDVTGTTSISGSFSFSDDDKLQLGNDNDLQIWHQSSNGNSIIKDTGPGSLSLQSNGNFINLWDSANAAAMLVANTGTDVELYYAGSEKLATRTDGVGITGNAYFPNGNGIESAAGATIVTGGGGGTWHVKPATSASNALVVENSAGTDKFVVDSAGSSDSYFVNTDVGVGTNAPATLLHLYSNAPILRLTDSDTGANSQISANSAVGGLQLQADIGDTVANSYISFATDGTTHMWIKENGHVGIGTNTPARQLHVYDTGGTTAAKVETGDANQASVDLKNTEGEFRIICDNGELRIYDQTDTSWRMVIDTNGNVGIGTTQPAHELHVASAADPSIMIEDTTDSNQVKINYKTQSYEWVAGVHGGVGSFKITDGTSFSGTNTDMFTIINSGNIGIGITNPSSKLHVNGDLRIDGTHVENGNTATLATTTETEVSNFSATTYGGAKLTIQVTDTVTDERQISEIIVVHDGVNAEATEYGIVFTNNLLATFDVDISGGNVRILATQVGTNSTKYKVALTQMLA